MTRAGKTHPHRNGARPHGSPAAPPDLVPLRGYAPGRDAPLPAILESMASTAFGAREVGRAWEVLTSIADRPDCRMILTISGAMTVAKMGPLLGGLIDRGLVGIIITTGALVTHGLVEEAGMRHFIAPRRSDAELRKRRLNRIYDTVEPERNLERLEEHAGRVYGAWRRGAHVSSADLIGRLTAEVADVEDGRGLLAAARRNGVGVHVPAFADSELGLYLYRQGRRGLRAPRLDPMLDLAQYEAWMVEQKEVAFLTIGGGVPRNFAQQLLPFLEALTAEEGRPRRPEVVGAVRICPDSVTLGHLSGSPYAEAVSWGKFPPDAPLVDVHADATVVLPFLGQALLDYVDAKAV